MVIDLNGIDEVSSQCALNFWASWLMAIWKVDAKTAVFWGIQCGEDPLEKAVVVIHLHREAKVMTKQDELLKLTISAITMYSQSLASPSSVKKWSSMVSSSMR